MKRTGLAIILAAAGTAMAAPLTYLEQIPVETFAKMREAERYQLKVAEKFFITGEYKAAASEYEKFMTLYDRSVGAPNAQLMWSHCMVHQRKVYGAVKDGFQSVIDYWPGSHEAMLASYLIGKSYNDIGETQNAEKAYARVIAAHPTHHVAVLAKWDLADIYRVRADAANRAKMWEDIAFNAKRDTLNNHYTLYSSRYLAEHHFMAGNFADGLKSLQTTYKDFGLVNAAHEIAISPIYTLSGNKEKAALGLKVADDANQFIRSQVPAATDDAAMQRIRVCYYHIASLHSHARRDKEGLDTYEQLSKLIGLDDGIRSKIGLWHQARARYEEARKVYAQFKDPIAGLQATALSFREEQKYDQAVAVYNQLVGSAKDREGEWHVQIVTTWRQAHKWDNAVVAYQALLKSVPERFGDWYWGMAECYEAAGKQNEAIQTFRQSDKYPGAYFRMAQCHRRLKQHSEALVLYNQARTEPSTAPAASLQIGYTYEEAGQMENAIKWFQQTCKLHPKSNQASTAHAHLQTKYKISVTLGGAADK